MDILIVEDESLIRQGLERVINEFDGYRVVGTADDGETALEWLQAADRLPDLVITDIFMQYVDGLELVEQINARFPDVKCALLSGHDDFRLAQQAISLKVCRYLTKPVNKEELGAALDQIRVEVEQEKLRKSDLLKWEQRNMSSALYVRDKLLSDLLEARLVSSDEISRYADCFNFDLETTQLAGGVIRLRAAAPDMSQRDSLLYSIAVKHLFTETMLTEYRGFIMLKDACTLVFGVDETSAERVRGAAHDFAALSESMLGIAVAIGVGDRAANLLKLRVAVARAFEHLESDREERRYPAELERKLREAIRTGDKEEAEKAARSFVERLSEHGAHTDYMLHSFYKLLESLELLFGELEHPFERPLLAELTRTGIAVRMNEWLHETIGRLEPVKQGGHNEVIARAIAHMEEHYGDCELSLQRLADLVYVHPNYLTQMFRKHTGYSCMQYLARLRMEKAKRLLKRPELKISEIAERVGYDNHLYFSSYFKKWIGKTPSDYKEGLASSDG